MPQPLFCELVLANYRAPSYELERRTVRHRSQDTVDVGSDARRQTRRRAVRCTPPGTAMHGVTHAAKLDRRRERRTTPGTHLWRRAEYFSDRGLACHAAFSLGTARVATAKRPSQTPAKLALFQLLPGDPRPTRCETNKQPSKHTNTRTHKRTIK